MWLRAIFANFSKRSAGMINVRSTTELITEINLNKRTILCAIVTFDCLQISSSFPIICIMMRLVSVRKFVKSERDKTSLRHLASRLKILQNKICIEQQIFPFKFGLQTVV